jgi:hypothetical protein
LGSKYLPSQTEFNDWRQANNKYFLLDTHTRTVTTFASLEGLRSVAASKGINLSFESPWDVYSRYRPIWFDKFFPAVSTLGLVGILLSLWPKFKQVQHWVAINEI